MNSAHNALTLIARVMMAAMFVASGYSKVGPGFAGTVGYISSVGLPLAQAGAVAAIVVEIGAGLALIVGYKTRWAALALMGFTLAAALLFHNFWAVPAAQQGMQEILFMKNLAVAGGLLMLAVAGPGMWSFDRGR